jgi:Domain of unknown function (DUF4126)
MEDIFNGSLNSALVAQAALAAAVAWGSGLRLYLVVLVLGLLGRFGGMELPDSLHFLAHPLVLGVAGLMALAEFLADKIPWLDSTWDVIHSFLRIPAGAALAASLFPSGGNEAVMATAALLGGGVTATTHFAKAGTRAAINTSPEPFTNIAASLTEETTLGAGLWAAFHHPAVFLVLLGVFLLISVGLITIFFRSIKRIFHPRTSSA